MTFAAMATWQALLMMAVVIAAAVGLFLLKLRPPQILIPSLTLWRRVLDEKRDRTLWERIRKAVSLAVAVLITLAIALAILRPQFSASTNAGRPEALAGRPSALVGRTGLEVRPTGTAAVATRTAIVIDSSWSMLAETASGQTRWDLAIARARALASGAGGEDVVLSTTADGVVEGPTADPALIEAALDRIAPSGGEAGGWPRVERARATYFLTDGAVARPLNAEVIVESVFEAAANVAITAFDVRPGVTLQSAGQVFLEVANYATTPQDVRISMTRGNASVLDVQVNMAPGTAVQRIVPLDRGGDARLRARVTAKANALVVDDDAVAWIPGAQALAVTVVSDQPASFGPLLSRDPGVRPVFVSAKNYTSGGADVVIFDRVMPAKTPTVPALYIAPPGTPALTEPKTLGVVPERTPDVLSSKEDTPQWVPDGWHPMLAGVDTQTMVLDRARPYAGAGLVPIARSAAGSPLIYVREASDQRFVIFTFSVTDSKLMFAPGFPVLLSNTIDWLAHPAQSSPIGTRRPGPATFAGSLASITGPDGKPVPVTQIDGQSIATLTRPGFYTATSGGATSLIAVNTADPDISDLQRTRIPATAAGADMSAAPARGRPWWLYATALALLLLGAEWLTWQRRITV